MEPAMKTLVKFVVTTAAVYGAAKLAPAIKREVQLERNTRKLQKLVNDRSESTPASV
jgi:hypothetical protein